MNFKLNIIPSNCNYVIVTYLVHIYKTEETRLTSKVFFILYFTYKYSLNTTANCWCSSKECSTTSIVKTIIFI